MSEPVATPVKPSLWHRLYHGETTFDFVGKRKWGFLLSGILILVALLSLFTRGLNLGLDFEGGVAWEVPATNGLTVGDVEGVLQDNDLDPGAAKIQTLSQGDEERIRVQVAAQSAETQVNVTAALAEEAEVGVNDVSVTSVSPTWGDEITEKAVRALVIFLIAITIYVSFRFEWRMAIAALVAVVHDVLVSVGVYSLFGWEVTPPTVIAFLTILGFSLYDTIVVFDKVHENTKRLVGTRATYSDIVNLSMNQVLMRSINTSMAALLPVASLLVVGSWMLGAIALRDFALALFVGLFVGSYSSIFIATPILAMLKEREPKYRALREKYGEHTTDVVALQAAAAGRPLQPAAAAAADEGMVTVAPVTTGLTHPPRPRRKTRR